MKTSKRNTNTMRETIGVDKRLYASKNEKNYMVVPQWLNVMYSTIFFNPCIEHLNAKKKDLDHFCINCLQPLCSNCLPQHMFHKHVKIRRYVYSDVINRQDLCKLFNCSGIQTYHTNKAKVVFLKQRHQQQQQQQQQQHQNNSREYRCLICHRNLQDNSLYCSVACKVLAIHGNECQRKIMQCGHNFENNTNEEHKEAKNFKDGKDGYLAVPFTKRQKRRRKGVPLRAPMF